MLGPVRFDHIRNCATEAIAKCKAGISKPVKQIKLGEDDRRREALVAILKERDQSVSVLRNLLAQKKGRAAKGQDNKDPPATANNYRTLPLQVLEKLEQVRDATIGWILKEIEKAEDTKSENSAGQVAQSPEREIKE